MTSTFAVRIEVLSATRISKSCVKTSTDSPAATRKWSSASTIVSPPLTYTRSAANASKLWPASSEILAVETSNRSTNVRPKASAARLTSDATVAYTSPYALRVASSVVKIVDPPAAISIDPEISASSRPALRESRSVADSSATVVLADSASLAESSMSEPLLMLKLRLATASSAATVAANVSSTRSSVLAAVTCRVSASDKDMLASTPTFTA